MASHEAARLDEIASGDRRFAALYRDAARAFGLSESAMWVLYYVHVAGEPITQQELVERMALSKQTVNSAVSWLASNGYVALEMIPGTRNRKEVLLTDEGEELVGQTVARLRAAEERAVRKLGDARARSYVRLHDGFLAALEGEFESAGIRDGE